MAIGKRALYRAIFTSAGDLTGAREKFGGLTAQTNHHATVLDIAITDHDGIAVTYDRLIHALVARAALGRSANTDYYGLLISVRAETRAAVLRDFETQAALIKKDKET